MSHIHRILYLCCLSVTLGLSIGNEGLVFRNRFHWFLRLGKRTHQLPLQRRSTPQLIIHLNQYHSWVDNLIANLIPIYRRYYLSFPTDECFPPGVSGRSSANLTDKISQTVPPQIQVVRFVVFTFAEYCTFVCGVPGILDPYARTTLQHRLLSLLYLSIPFVDHVGVWWPSVWNNTGLGLVPLLPN